jgi:hypothetical protein
MLAWVLALVRLASGMVSQQALARAFQQALMALVLTALVLASADPVGLASLAVLASPPLLADL